MAAGPSGALTVTIPLPLPPGRSGFRPELALAYDSMAGNGPFGLGWNVAVPFVGRRTERGVPRYGDEDPFVLSGADDLVPAGDTPGRERVTEDGRPYLVERYRPRVERDFARIERWTAEDGGQPHWVVATREGVVHRFGRSPDARVADPADPRRIFRWLLEESADALGNRIAYAYRPEDRVGVDPAAQAERNRGADGQRYLSAIRYGNAPVAAGGGYRFLVVLDYGGHEQTPGEARPWPVRADPFSTCRPGFELRTRRLCRRVLVFHDFPELGAGPCLVGSLDLTYLERPDLSLLAAITRTGYRRDAAGGYTASSLPPLELTYTEARVADAVQDLDGAGAQELPAGIDGRHRWVDLEDDGIAGVLGVEAGAWRFVPNLGGGRLGASRLVAALPAPLDGPSERLDLLDLAGDGGRSLVRWDGPLAGFRERAEDGGWGPHTPFASLPELDWSDPNLRLLDLDGDGVADVLLSQDGALASHRSLGRAGFADRDTTGVPADEEAGPRLVFADGTGTVLVADMNGDGLPDLVRVGAGEVAYWPNLGHGRFGPRVAMAGAPVLDAPDAFRPDRVRLADIDGTGAADLVYLGPDRVRCWTNQAGNAWGPARELTFPDVDGMAGAAVVDVLGSGTACLVWSSPAPRDAARPLRYLDLAGGKPHLLAAAANNLGADIRVSYAPSTRFLLEDRAAGVEWATTPPFPIQVVERLEALESVTGTRTVRSYRYRHGYYDRAEREFWGFGLVEERDAETFAATGTDQPPVRTRTWYHTGAYRAEEALTERYEREQFAGDRIDAGPALTFDGGDRSLENVRDGHRALRGRMLRREVCALDGGPLAETPYLVDVATYAVRRLAPGVCMVHPRLQLTASYERDAGDPRVSQALTLDVDAFGNVTRSAAAGLARRVPRLPEQARALATVTESAFFNGDPAAPRYRAGVRTGSTTWELPDLAPSSRPLTPADLEAAAGTRRLVARDRRLFWRDDLAGPLPAGIVGSLGLPHRAYGLALPADLVPAVYGTRVAPEALADAGYVDLDGDGSWWAPSDLVVPDPDRFFLPAAREDPFGGRARVAHDSHALLVVEAEDAAGNVQRFGNDYRTLAPASVVDVNGNVSAVATDELGRVTAVAVGGRPGSGEGQTLDDPTRTFAYDLERWRRERLPALALLREREADGPGGRWRELRTYSDGMGRAVQMKASARPDASGAPRWLSTGRMVFDNKGSPVAQYEPSFSSTPEYDRDAGGDLAIRVGYDPIGRRVRVDLPDGTFSRVEPGAWRQARWDPNDTVLESAWLADVRASGTAAQRRAADQAVAHAGTPAVEHLDPLGRVVLAVADNGAEGTSETRHELDVAGRVLSVTDPNGAVAERSRYDLLGRRVLVRGADTGLRWVVLDVASQPVLSGDGREVVVRRRFDALRRPTHRWVSAGGGPEALVERTVYGEDVPDAAVRNLRGRVSHVFHQAGATVSERFDWRGDLLLQRQRARADPAAAPDWSALADLHDPDALERAAAPLLDPEPFDFATAYDALGRPVSVRAPDGSETLTAYDEAGLLRRVEVAARAGAATAVVEDVRYDARGERELVRLGGGVETRFERDPRTLRLDRLLTVRGGTVLQDRRHTYDPAGNVTEIADAAEQAVFFDGAVVPPGATYVHDALYRLRRATGREHPAAAAAPPDDRDHWRSVPDPRDGTALVAYTETYAYDAAGNLAWVQHETPAGGWQRRYAYEPGGNRLAATSLPGDTAGQLSARYEHDAAGNVVRMPHLARLDWDHAGRLTAADALGGGRVQLAYDESGARARKAVESGGLLDEVLTFGSFEVSRRLTASGVVARRETLHVGDTRGRLALLETRVVEDGRPVPAPAPLLRYQLGDHLGSVALETDEAGRLVSYEEYHPFGSTAYQAPRSRLEANPKRYRFTGRERDERTGLGHHGARCYASWLGRWVSPDPAGMVDGTNLYAYASNSPVRLRDVTGLVPTPDEIAQVAEQVRTQADVQRTLLGTLQRAEATLERLPAELRDVEARIAALEARPAQTEVTELALQQLRQRSADILAEIPEAGRRLGAIERGAIVSLTESEQLATRARAVLEAVETARAGGSAPPPIPQADPQAGPYRVTVEPEAALRSALGELRVANEGIETALRGGPAPPPPPPRRGGGGGAGGGGAPPGEGPPPQPEGASRAGARSAADARGAQLEARAARAAGVVAWLGILWQGLVWEYTWRRFGFIEFGGLRTYRSWGDVPEGSRVQPDAFGPTGRKIGGRFVPDPT